MAEFKSKLQLLSLVLLPKSLPFFVPYCCEGRYEQIEGKPCKLETVLVKSVGSGESQVAQGKVQWNPPASQCFVHPLCYHLSLGSICSVTLIRHKLFKQKV